MDGKAHADSPASARVRLDAEDADQFDPDADLVTDAAAPINSWIYVILGVAIVGLLLIVMQLVSSQPG
ncbi:hypothetical protein XM25_00095 [Devosia sp. H5989]|nr:hypothetical protein XM25_00095 [Devosia sp. H5989]